MNRSASLIVTILFLWCGGVTAAPREQPRLAAEGDRLFGEPVRLAGAKADSFVLLRSTFQDGDGMPSREGWTSVDLTTTTDPIWHVDTFHCRDLDPLTVPNHAWWCGESRFACEDGSGYGNGYQEWLDWYGDVPDPALATTVRLTAKLNHDSEPGYDFLHLEVSYSLLSIPPDRTGMRSVRTWEGRASGVGVDVSFTVPAEDYVNSPRTGASAVHLRFAGISDDGGWSDEDCLWPTDGLAQIDLIRVTFDQGGGPIQVGPVEDCEGTTIWSAASPVGVGDFAKVWPLLDDLDPCTQNFTPQFAFIDDGLVVPGTGGTRCISWCYGPGGYTVNPNGGLAGPLHHLDNEIWSPVLDYPAGYDGCLFEWDVWSHQIFLDGMFYTWGVRSIDDAAPEPAWTEWVDDDFVYYVPTRSYFRRRLAVGGHLVPGRTRIQVKLGIIESGWFWGWDGPDATPAPYYDNVRVTAYALEGPSLYASEGYLAQDDFPAIGSLDYADLGNNSVRFDMAAEISTAASMQNVPGDSIWVEAAPVRVGSTLDGPPQLVYRLKPNPLFGPHRTSGAPNEGVVGGNPTYYPNGNRVPNRFDFDLPDSGFFFPGDVIHYFFKATDSLGGVTLLPGDTTGFSLFPGDPGFTMLQYPSSFVVRALPTLRSGTPGDQPRVLFWNDFGNRGGEQEWLHALRACGYAEGDNLDIYYTNAPASGLGNGLGGRATAAQVSGYEAILYSSGDLSQYTITGVDYTHDPGDDLGLLDAWLRQGGKGLFLTGDELIYSFTTNGGVDGVHQRSFMASWIRVVYNGRSVGDLLGGNTFPKAQRVPLTGGPVFNAATRWAVDGGCPVLNQFDAVTAGSGATPIAEFLGSACGAGAYPYAAAVQTVDPGYAANVIYLPYDLMYVMGDTDCGGDPGAGPGGVRAAILRDVLAAFGAPAGSPTVDAPLPGLPFTASVAPNPFNPKTTVRTVMPGAGRLTVAVYDVRGRLVQTLHDGIVEAGARTFDWLGTDGGAAAASGVYFVQVRSDHGARTLKAALVR